MRRRHKEMCGRLGCDAAGKWRPIVRFGVAPIHTVIEVAICDAHKASSTMTEVMADLGFRTMMRALMTAGFSDIKQFSDWELGWEPAP